MTNTIPITYSQQLKLKTKLLSDTGCQSTTVCLRHVRSVRHPVLRTKYTAMRFDEYRRSQCPFHHRSYYILVLV